MQLVDTHCHIHFDDYQLDSNEVIEAALSAGVTRMICVGCTLNDSRIAIEYAAKHRSIWASIGMHPHEAKLYVENEKALQEFRSLAENHARLLRRGGETTNDVEAHDATMRRVVAIGETGLDYYYNHSPKEDQQELFRFQLTLAQEYNLPVIFHVRDAFDDFFAILSNFKGIRGVVHSFTANTTTLDKCLKAGLYIGLNGIMTFTKDAAQLEAAKAVPLHRLLLETDAPFLTPVPFRGTICQPKHVVETAKFLSHLRQESLEELAAATTHNAGNLFNL